MVQHTGGEDRKVKTNNLMLHFQGPFNPSIVSLHNIHEVLDCVSDGGAESAGGDQLSTAAVLPEGDHRTETNCECSGG